MNSSLLHVRSFGTAMLQLCLLLLLLAPSIAAQDLTTARTAATVSQQCEISTTISAESDPGAPVPVCMVLVLDASSSMVLASGRMQAAKDAATGLVNGLNPSSGGDVVGLVTYGTTATLAAGLDTDGNGNFSGVLSAISAVNPPGSPPYQYTNIADAAKLATATAASCPAGKAPVLVVISDGIANRYTDPWPGGTLLDCNNNPTTSTDCTDEAEAAGQAASTAGNQVYSVALDLDPGDAEEAVGIATLQGMATDAGSYFDASTTSIADILQDIKDDAGQTTIFGSSYEETLPNCWAYVPGSTTGATTNNPVCVPGVPSDGNRQTCTWPLGGFAGEETKAISYGMDWILGCAAIPFSVTIEDGEANYSNAGGAQTVGFPNSSPLDITPCRSSLPVELTSFSGRIQDGAIVLDWSTASESNNAGFQVEHALEDGAFSELGFVEGTGTSDRSRSYTFRYSDFVPGNHLFRLGQVDFDGTVSYSEEIEVVSEIADRYFLSEAYPNPFNPQTRLQFAVSASQEVTVALYSPNGQMVKALYSGNAVPNRTYDLTVNAEGLPSGIYLVRMMGSEFTTSRRVVLLK